MPSINYERFTNEPDDESTFNVGVSVIDVPNQTVKAPPSLLRQRTSQTSAFDKYTDCFKSTALSIYVKLCVFLVIVVHLALAAFGLIFWSSHSKKGSLSQDE